jgi:hypothetical protein
MGRSFSAGATGFEPAISALTGPHVKPLHHAPKRKEGSLSRGCGDVKKSHEVCREKLKSVSIKFQQQTLKAICINKL